MSLPVESFISKFQVKGKQVYAKIEWQPNENDLFHIQLSEDNCFWSGRLSNEFAQVFQERYEIPSQYNNDVKQCLLGEDSNFLYDFGPVSGDADSAKFSCIKKYTRATKIICTVPLHRDDKGDKFIFMNDLIDENRQLKKMVQQLQIKTGTLNDELEQCNSNMARFIDLKSSVESSLYSRFIQLLNAKKKRIESLDEQLNKVSKTSKEQSGTDLD